MTAAPEPLPGSQRAEESARRPLPDYLPARMLNEYVYCPRLFFYEWVEGVFRESADTVEGKLQHARLDAKPTAMPGPQEVEGAEIHSRSITLSSETHKVIARMDLVEVRDGVVTPVDYKHGRPRQSGDGIELWPADKAQLAIQALILKENGYACEEGIVFYVQTRQRVRVTFDEELLRSTAALAAEAWRVAEGGRIPPPLEGSPKCQGCSLVTICLPDETRWLGSAPPEGVEAAPVQLSLFENGSAQARPRAEVRPLIAPRDDLRPLYLNTQGLRVGRSGEVLQVREQDTLKQEVRLHEICQLNLMGNIQLTTQAIQALCDRGIPICYFSQGGWFYGITMGLNTKNVFLRRAQYRLAEEEWFARRLARRLVAGKIRNQRTMLQRNHIEPDPRVLRELKEMAERAEQAGSMDELLGIEGNAARLYFQHFSGMIKVEKEGEEHRAQCEFAFDFNGRNRRPPRDPVNALLSLAYSVLTKDLTIACYAVGFDPYLGYYHQPRFGRPALALDLMEPFRPLIADSAVLSAINTRMVSGKDFVRTGPAVSLTQEGRKNFFRAYELRMDGMVTHPLFDYRVSYRRLLEIQARLLARVLEGEIGSYPVFVTR
jgi:CRISPR-associated protein Cas1